MPPSKRLISGACCPGKLGCFEAEALRHRGWLLRKQLITKHDKDNRTTHVFDYAIQLGLTSFSPDFDIRDFARRAVIAEGAPASR